MGRTKHQIHLLFPAFMEIMVVTEEAVEILEFVVVLVLVLIQGVDFVKKKKKQKKDLSVV
jgi:hypothetical protein